MPESIVARVRRIISASIEDTVDSLERAGGTSVMREVDRVLDEVRAEHDAVTTRRLQAQRQQRLFRERLAGLDDKARFALSQGRDDLAEAAVARHLDFEGQVRSLEQAEQDAAVEAARLDECVVALQSRKKQMEESLATFEAARREAAPGKDEPARGRRKDEGRVARAEAAFDRAMSGAGGVAGFTPADAQATAKVAEIDAMQRSAAIAERLAALRSAQAAG